MRTKLITVFLISFSIFIGILVWRVDDLIFSDKLAWNEAQVRSQMSPIIHALEMEFQNLSEILNITSSSIDSKKEYPKGSPLARHQMIAQLQPASGKEWVIEKSFFLEKSPAKSWGVPYTTLLLKTIDAKEIKPGGFAVFSLLDPQRKPFLFVVHNMPTSTDGNGSAGSVWYGVLTGPEFFQSLMDRQKGQISTLFMVNNQGQALAHSTPEYVGNLLSQDPMVSELMKTQSANGSGIFKDLRSESIQGFYEQVPQSNVYAVITTPLNQLLKGRGPARWQLILMGLGLAFVGSSIFVVLYRAEAAPSFSALPPAASVAVGPVSASVVSKPLAPAPPPADDLQPFVRVASALSHELRGPLSSILGHAQLLKSAGGENEHLIAIEEQTRKARDLIQQLMAFSGDAEPKIEKVKITDVLNKALRHVEAKIFRKGIHLVRDFKVAAEYPLPADQIGKAIENILNNAIESMERVPKKELKVSATDKDGAIEILILDTGEGIETQNLSKIYDPFFTTRSSQAHVGLGLSMAAGILREAGAQLDIESERGRGTEVKIVLPPPVAVMEAPTQSVPFTPPPPPSAPPVPAPAGAVSVPASIAASKPMRELVIPNLNQELLVLEDKEVEEVLDIENMEDDPLAKRQVSDAEIDFPPEPLDLFQEPQTTAAPVNLTAVSSPPVGVLAASAKIDRPNIEIQKKSSKLDQVGFQIRKPGERV